MIQKTRPPARFYAMADELTAAAISVLAAVTVICTHEAIGHGSVCLALGGQIETLTSSLFRCTKASALIDPAGPAANLGIGAVAMWLCPIVRRGRPNLTLFLILVSAMSFFWEGGYLVKAMYARSGDLYFAGYTLFGEPSLWWRQVGGALGGLFYLATLMLISHHFLQSWPQAEVRRLSRISWISATLATLLAATAYNGSYGSNLGDTFLEIGLASAGLLFLPLSANGVKKIPEPMPVKAHPGLFVATAAVFILFVLTLGRGLGH